MKSQEEVVVCGDGRCDSPGHSASTNTYTLPVTQVSNSNAIEIKGFKEALKTREGNKVSQPFPLTDIL